MYHLMRSLRLRPTQMEHFRCLISIFPALLYRSRVRLVFVLLRFTTQLACSQQTAPRLAAAPAQQSAPPTSSAVAAAALPPPPVSFSNPHRNARALDEMAAQLARYAQQREASAHSSGESKQQQQQQQLSRAMWYVAACNAVRPGQTRRLIETLAAEAQHFGVPLDRNAFAYFMVRRLAHCSVERSRVWCDVAASAVSRAEIRDA